MLITLEAILTGASKIYGNFSHDLQSEWYRTRHRQRIFLFVLRLLRQVEVFMGYVATLPRKQPYGIYMYLIRQLGIGYSSDRICLSPLNQFPNLRSHDPYFFTNISKNANRLL